MAQTYSITLSDNSDITFDALDPQAVTLEVYINGSTTADSDAYDVITDLSNLSITRQLGTVTIVPSMQNKTNYDKEGYIVFYNRGDSTVFTTVNVTQEHIDYSVSIYSEDGDTSNSIVCEPFEEQVHTFNIRVYGGQKKFYVNTVNKYTSSGSKDTYDDVLTTSTTLADDSNKEYSDYTFTVTTYGVLEVGATYEIVLSHWNARDVQYSINVSFDIDSEGELPTLTSSGYVYCTSTTSMTSFEEEPTATVTAMVYTTTSTEEVAEEEPNEISILCDGKENPSVIDITDGDVKVEVNTRNDVYAKLSTGWCTTRYEKPETGNKRYVYFRPVKENNLSNRYASVKLYDIEDRTNYIKFCILQRGKTVKG